MREEIILDLDGVLIDFVRSAFNAWGVYDYEYPTHCGWDISEALNVIRGERSKPVPPRQFWNSFDQEWWATLPWYPGAREFYQMLVDSGADITICTSATLSPACAAGKLEWINRELPELKRKYFIGQKHKLAKHRRVLIDDADHNVEAFRQAGGDSVLVPRPWNQNNKYSNSSFQFARNCLKMMGVVAAIEKVKESKK